MDTFKFATNSGDKTFLSFIHDRLINKHGEDELYDYMWCLRDFRDGINEVVSKSNSWDRLPRIIKWLYRV